ncbi:MAG: SlyX family protein [Ghiorsea sp.]
MEDRIVDLETKSAYQEHLIQELNEVVIKQQNQMDALEKSLLHLKDYIRNNEGQQSAPEQEAPPPHY